MNTASILNIDYIPILTTRPAEMKALEELPEHDKNSLLPLLLIRPWTTALRLSSTFLKVKEVFGDRKWIGEIDPTYSPPEDIDPSARPALEEFLDLRDPGNGYNNWCTFVESEPSIIPCALLGEISELAYQIKKLYSLGRGYVIRLPKIRFGILDNLLDVISENGPDQIIFILDYGQISSRDLPSVAHCSSLAEKILNTLPACRVAISATSFPDSFSNLPQESIGERSFFNSVAKLLPTASVIYSDRGSAREERRQKGGGFPVPRIDYPLWDIWKFYRNNSEQGYEEAARELTSDPSVWNSNIRVWGTQMIERTAMGDRYAIISPVRSTAVRINLHLHRQLFYNKKSQITKLLEDEWVD